jgi:hypothetical protein
MQSAREDRLMKTWISASLVAGCVLASVAPALAAEPTQTDFDACNRMAQSKVTTPSASPQSPRSDAKSAPAGGPQAAPSPEPAAQARVENQADQLRGIADASKSDPAYQKAYRDCMKGRGL